MAKAEKRVFKTKKKLAGGKTEYRAWNEWDEGDVIIGKYVGSSQNRKNATKKDWIVEVVDCQFADKKEAKRLLGKTVTLNCAGQLDKGMNAAELGDLVQITYNGQQEMKGGPHAGKMAHLHEVEIVEEDDGEEDEDADLDDDEEEADEDEEESEDDEDYL